MPLNLQQNLFTVNWRVHFDIQVFNFPIIIVSSGYPIFVSLNFDSPETPVTSLIRRIWPTYPLCICMAFLRVTLDFSVSGQKSLATASDAGADITEAVSKWAEGICSFRKKEDEQVLHYSCIQKNGSTALTWQRCDRSWCSARKPHFPVGLEEQLRFTVATNWKPEKTEEFAHPGVEAHNQDLTFFFKAAGNNFLF